MDDEEPPLEKEPAPPVATPKPQHPFYAYASEYWLSHTSTIRKEDSHYKLWKKLILAPNNVAPKPWEWKSRSWSEPEDPGLLQAIVEFNHSALLGTFSLLVLHSLLIASSLECPALFFKNCRRSIETTTVPSYATVLTRTIIDLIIELHLAQTSHLPASPKFRSILLYLASRGTLPLFHCLLDHSSTLPFALWGDSFDAAISGGCVPIMKLLLQPDSWDTEPLRFSSRGTRLDLMSGGVGNGYGGGGSGGPAITSESARMRVALAKERLAHHGPLAGLKLLMEMESEKDGTAVGYVELLQACKERDEPFVERILATGVDPRKFPRHEYRAIRGVMRDKGEL